MISKSKFDHNKQNGEDAQSPGACMVLQVEQRIYRRNKWYQIYLCSHLQQHTDGRG